MSRLTPAERALPSSHSWKWTGSGKPVEFRQLVGIDDVAPEIDDDPQLKEPGWMRALTTSKCRACDLMVDKGTVQALVDLPDTGPAWVHGACTEPEAGS